MKTEALTPIQAAQELETALTNLRVAMAKFEQVAAPSYNYKIQSNRAITELTKTITPQISCIKSAEKTE